MTLEEAKQFLSGTLDKLDQEGFAVCVIDSVLILWEKPPHSGCASCGDPNDESICPNCGMEKLRCS